MKSVIGVSQQYAKVPRDIFGNIDCLLIAFSFSISLVLPFWAQDNLKMISALSVSVLLAALCFVILKPIKSCIRSTPSSRNFIFGNEIAFRNKRRFFVIAFLTVWSIYLLSLLSNFPGLYSVDSNDVFNQAMGTSHWSLWHRYEGLSNHHPVAYTMLVRLCIQGGMSISDGNIIVGLVIYSIAQITLVSLMYAWAISWLNKKRIRKSFVVFALVFFSCNPIILCYSVTMWKDVLFSSGILVISLLLFELAYISKREIGALETIIKPLVSLFFFLLMISLLRSNGLITAVVIYFGLLIVMRRFRKIISAMTLMLVLIVLFIQGPIYNALGAQPAHFSETVAIPLQQLSAVVVNDGSIDSESRETLDRIVPFETIKDKYQAHASNGVKFAEDFNDDYLDTHKADFIKAWVFTMPANLKTYVKAWINETSGYYQPFSSAHVLRVGKIIADNVKSVSLLPLLPHYLQVNEIIDAMPALASAGTLFWILIMSVVVTCWTYKQGRIVCMLLPYLPYLILVVVLLVAVPIKYDFRYVYSLMLAIPFFPVFCGPYDLQN